MELLTVQAKVLAYLSRHPTATMREIGYATGFTERTVAKACEDLRDSGLVASTRSGRRAVREVGLSRTFGVAPGVSVRDLCAATQWPEEQVIEA